MENIRFLKDYDTTYEYGKDKKIDPLVDKLNQLLNYKGGIGFFDEKLNKVKGVTDTAALIMPKDIHPNISSEANKIVDNIIEIMKNKDSNINSKNINLPENNDIRFLRGYDNTYKYGNNQKIDTLIEKMNQLLNYEGGIGYFDENLKQVKRVTDTPVLIIPKNTDLSIKSKVNNIVDEIIEIMKSKN